MAYIIDGPTKTISLSLGTVEVSVRDLWSRWVDWFLTGDNSKYSLALTNVGGNDIDPGAGTSIPIYAFLLNGWRIKPQEANHTLVINDGILLVDGGGDPFINTTGSFIVRINYQQPVQAITVSTGGGGGLTVGQDTKLKEIHQSLMLDATAPVTTTPNSITFDTVEIELTGDPETSITGQRV